MNLQTQPRGPRPQNPTPPSLVGGGNSGTGANAQQPGVPPSSVMVHYGIHRGYYPVRGQRVGDARRTLARVMNIDPSAVAVIGGRIVNEDEIITSNVTLLSFVPPSAVKG